MTLHSVFRGPGAIAAFGLLFSSFAFADVEQNPSYKPEAFGEQKGLFIEYMNYQDHVYSLSRKTELGDRVELDTSVRYQYDPDTFGRIRFETDPVDNRTYNKTSKFELLVAHNFGPLFVQVDGQIDTDEKSSDGTGGGGISIGFDLDSKLTVISYILSQTFEVKFFPFNFDGEVGRQFNTWDVTRLYFIDGSPSTVNNTQLGDEKIVSKTIPGFELGYYHSTFEGNSYFYIGGGAATYLYPSNSDFDIENSRTADRWERKEDFGYKAGFKYTSERLRAEVKYVGHTQSSETGSLLASAGSVYVINRIKLHLIENELTYSHAGSRPYRLNRDGDWFEQETPFEPIYSDYNGLYHQDWLGKEDFAYSLRVGHEFTTNRVPYVTFKYQGKNFVFRERESAHLLRTADERYSHGGLSRYGAGMFYYVGNIVINPEFEWLHANNPVFANSSDVRDDRHLSSFKKDDFSVFLTVSYNFGENKIFRP